MAEDTGAAPSGSGAQRLSLPSGTELQVRPYLYCMCKMACARWHAFYCIKPLVHAESVLHIANIGMLDLQIAMSDREQEIMGAAGLLTIGGSAGVGRGTLERVLRVLPGEITPTS